MAKALQLIQGLRLSEREIRHLVTHPSDFDQFTLRLFPLARPSAGETVKPL